MKNTLKILLEKFVNLFAGTVVGRYVYPLFSQAAVASVLKAPGNSNLRFHVPNAVNRYRVETFLTKEPETLEWLGRIPRGSVVWDIGANVGLYTCAAAKFDDSQSSASTTFNQIWVRSSNE